MIWHYQNYKLKHTKLKREKKIALHRVTPTIRYCVWSRHSVGQAYASRISLYRAQPQIIIIYTETDTNKIKRKMV